MRKLVIMFAITMMAISCTENTRVKRFGATSHFDLELNQKLVNVTWKDNELWTLTRDMTPSDTVVTYKFSEKSRFGVLEGSFIIHESKK